MSKKPCRRVRAITRGSPRLPGARPCLLVWCAWLLVVVASSACSSSGRTATADGATLPDADATNGPRQDVADRTDGSRDAPLATDATARGDGPRDATLPCCALGIAFQNSYATLDYSAAGVDNRGWVISQFALLAGRGTDDAVELQSFIDATDEQITDTFTRYREAHPELQPGTNDWLVIDIEGPKALSALRNYKDSPDTQVAIVEGYKRRIRVVRAAFPHARLGVWSSLPTLTNTDATRQEHLDLMAGFALASDLGLFDLLDVVVPNLYHRYGPTDANYAKIEAISRRTLEQSALITTSNGDPLPMVPFFSFLVYNGNSAHHQEPAPVEATQRLLAVLQEFPTVEHAFFWGGANDTSFGIDLLDYLMQVQQSP